MRIRKPWTEWDDGIDPREIPGAMGIYELADEQHRTLYIGKAGGDSPFGLRGELFRHFSSAETLASRNWTHPRMGETLPSIASAARYYRYEVTHQYYGRWIEALTRFHEDHDALPPANVEDVEQPPPLGRYHWKSEEATRGS